MYTYNMWAYDIHVLIHTMNLSVCDIIIMTVGRTHQICKCRDTYFIFVSNTILFLLVRKWYHFVFLFLKIK